MGVNVILDKSIIGYLPTYELSEKDVNSFTLDTNTDASNLVKEYLIPFLFSSTKRNFRRSGDADKIRTTVDYILNIDDDHYDSEEEYDSYRKYMKTLFDKIEKLDILETVDKSKILHPSTVIFGQHGKKETGLDEKAWEKKKKDSNYLINKLKDRTFGELSNAAILGDTLRSTKDSDDASRFRDKIQDTTLDVGSFLNGKKLRNVTISKLVNDYEVQTIIDMEKYYKELLDSYGFDMKENFVITQDTKDTLLDTDKLKQDLEKHLRPTRINGVIAGYKTNIDDNKEVDITDMSDTEKMETRKSIMEGINKNKNDFTDYVIKTQPTFFLPFGKNRIVSFAKIIITISFGDDTLVPIVKVINESGDTGLKLLSTKQFVQTVAEGTKPLIVIGSINRMLSSAIKDIQEM